MDAVQAAPSDAPRSTQAVGGQFRPGIALVGLVLGGSWVWWALSNGAYFDTVFNPGVVLLAVTLAVLLAIVPFWGRLKLSTPVRVGVTALGALAVWALASALWSPAPDVAIGDAQRVLAYLVAFGLGVWFCNMLGRRMDLALVPLAAAAGVVGVVTLVKINGAHDLTRLLDGDGTLQYPLGYRNANAAFFLIAMWPALALAGWRGLDWRFRGLALASATLCLELAVISQSRGSLVGVVAGFIAYLLVARRRIRALLWLEAAVLPALLAVHPADQLYRAANQHGLQAAHGPLQDAAVPLALGALIALVLGLILAWADRRLEGRRPNVHARRAGATIVVAPILIGLVAVIVAIGNPVSWVGDRVDEFLAGQPNLTKESNRFTFNAGSDRSDIWRVAIATGADKPLFGEGGGGFEYRYLLDRHSRTQLARDAHSVELETFSELGAPGLVLLLVGLGGIGLGAIRTRRLGPNAAVLSLGAVSAAAYWFAHTSLDWFWPYPGVTAPVLALLGSACAPALLNARPAPGPRRSLFVACILLAVSVVPFYLSSELIAAAGTNYRSDPNGAFDRLTSAEQLNPWNDEPKLIEGVIAQRLGQRARAIDAFRAAIHERPEESAGHYFLARIYAKRDPQLARSELSVVRSLNPLSDRIKPLERLIAADERRAAPSTAKDGSGAKG